MYDSYTAAVVQERVAELFREAEQARLVQAARKARRHRRAVRTHTRSAPSPRRI
jgi:hypothetical protein